MNLRANGWHNPGLPRRVLSTCRSGICSLVAANQQHRHRLGLPTGGIGTHGPTVVAPL